MIATRAKNRGIAQPGSAEVLGTSGRRFKSCCPDQIFATGGGLAGVPPAMLGSGAAH